MSVFLPNIILSDVTMITLDMLKQNHIKGIILDVDNTLTTHGSQEIKAHISDWLDLMKNNNIKLIIVSNNTYERIEPFARNLKLDFVAMGCKPLTGGFTKAQRKLGLLKDEIAVVGDQIYTDIVGGNLKGFFTILVSPFELENGKFFKFKRALESIHIRKYNRRKSKEK